MSDVRNRKEASARACLSRKNLREDLRLDCLRLALQRQGARDSRGLLEIAEEYFGWVTADGGREPDSDSVSGPAPSGAHDWSAARKAVDAALPLATKPPAGGVKISFGSDAARRSARRFRSSPA